MVHIFLLRHANIDEPPMGLDPSLNAAGQARALDLVRVAELAGVATIFTSPLKRTKETAAPLAARLGLTTKVVPPADEFAIRAHMGQYGPVVLVVGHSNTVPEMIAALTNKPAPPFLEGFDNLVLVSLSAAETSVVNLKYGAAST